MEPGLTEMGAHSPILVTGAHRTGTTWAGKMLAAAPGVGYISEPLNRLHRPGVLRLPVAHWYTYICEDNQSEFLKPLRETLAFRYHTAAELRSLRSRKDVLRMGRDWSSFLRGRLGGQRPLIKDPFAVFSAGWFARALGCRVVITVRHPAGFASSLKRLGWQFDFADLLAQPLLMRDWLEPYRSEMEAAQARPEDLFGQAGLLWRMIYAAVSRVQDDHPDFLVVRHEDLSLDPVGGYRRLYRTLGLAFTPRVEQTIHRSTGAGNPAERPSEAIYTTRLDSRLNLDNWKRRLEPGEIERLRRLTEPVAGRFYDEETWD